MASRKTPFLKVFTKREPKFQLHESTMSFMSDDMGDLMKYSGTGARKKQELESCDESEAESDNNINKDVPSSPLRMSRSSSLRDLKSHLSRTSSKEFTDDDGDRSQNTAPVQGNRSSGLSVTSSPMRTGSPRRPRISPGSLKIKGLSPRLFSSAKSPFSSKNKKAANSNIIGELAISSLSGDEEEESGQPEETTTTLEDKQSEHRKAEVVYVNGKATLQQPQKTDRPKKRRGGRRPGRKSSDDSETSLQNLPPADAEAKVRTFNRSISTDTFAQFELGEHVPMKEKKPKVDGGGGNTEKTNSSSSSDEESGSSSEAAAPDDDDSVTEAAESVAPSVTESTDDDHNHHKPPPSPSRGRKVRVMVRQRRKSSRSRGRSRGKSRGRTTSTTATSSTTSSTTTTTDDDMRRRRTSKDVEDEVRELLGLKPASDGGVGGSGTRKKAAAAAPPTTEEDPIESSQIKQRSVVAAPSQMVDSPPTRSILPAPSHMAESPPKPAVSPSTKSQIDYVSPAQSQFSVPRDTTGSLRQVFPSSESNKFDESMAVLSGEEVRDMETPSTKRSVFGHLRKAISERSFSLSPRRMVSQRNLIDDTDMPGMDASRREEDEPLIEILDSPRRKSKFPRDFLSSDPLQVDTFKKEDPAEAVDEGKSPEKDEDQSVNVEKETLTEKPNQTVHDVTVRRKSNRSRRRSKTPNPKPRSKDKVGRLKRRASLNNISTAKAEPASLVRLDSFVVASNNKTGESAEGAPTKQRRATQSTRPRRKLSVAEMEKSTTSFVAIDAVRDVGGSKGKSPRRRIRKRMTVDYSGEKDIHSSEPKTVFSSLYASPNTTTEATDGPNEDDTESQQLVAINDEGSDAEESDVEPVAQAEHPVVSEDAVEEENQQETTTDDATSVVASIVSNDTYETSDTRSLPTTDEPKPTLEETLESAPPNVSVEPTTVVVESNAGTEVITKQQPQPQQQQQQQPQQQPQQEQQQAAISPESIRKEYTRLQSELNVSKMRMRLASLEVGNLEREIQQLRDRLGTFDCA